MYIYIERLTQCIGLYMQIKQVFWRGGWSEGKKNFHFFLFCLLKPEVGCVGSDPYMKLEDSPIITGTYYVVKAVEKCSLIPDTICYMCFKILK